MKITDIKKGMKVLLRNTSRGYDHYCGLVAEVTSVNITNRYCNVKFKSSVPVGYANSYSFYPENGDEVIVADRKEQAKYLKEKVKEYEKEIAKMKAEIEFLDKYETEEDFVAAKLDAILTAGNKKDPKARLNAIKEVITTLKETHYL